MHKVAAIWARVSSRDQTSLPDQAARAKQRLEELGYSVPPDRILTVDWTSMDLFDCPQFLQLARWVERNEIQALGVLDRDRLHAEPAQRLAFLAELQGKDIELIVCQGPPMVEGDWGGLIEHVHAIGKKQQVLRAKLGAKDGLHDKVVRDRKPTSRHYVTGYTWTSDTQLEPNSAHAGVQVIFELAKKGETYSGIQKEQRSRGILSPRGLTEWDRSAIRGIIQNPIYAGRYYAERYYKVKPKNRRVKTYGNSSFKMRTLDEAVYLPEVEIIDPPITWEEREQIMKQRKTNQKLARRNARLHDYLLRGPISCYTHFGKRGEPRVYHGNPTKNAYSYACPVGQCGHPTLYGPQIEERVKRDTAWLLELEAPEFYRHIGSQVNVDQTRASLLDELTRLEAKYNRNVNAETELENRDLLGQEHPEVYRRLKARLKAERIWIDGRRSFIDEQLSRLTEQAQIADSWWELRERLVDRLEHLTNGEWRELFVALNLEVHVRDKRDPATWPETWYTDEMGVLRNRNDVSPVTGEVAEADDIEICFGLPVDFSPKQARRVNDIVFTTASCSS